VALFEDKHVSQTLLYSGSRDETGGLLVNRQRERPLARSLCSSSCGLAPLEAGAAHRDQDAEVQERQAQTKESTFHGFNPPLCAQFHFFGAPTTSMSIAREPSAKLILKIRAFIRHLLAVEPLESVTV